MILCVAVEVDLSFSDKGSVLVNVRFHPWSGNLLETGGIVCAAYLVTQQSAKGCTTRQSIVFALLISTWRMSLRHMTNGVLYSHLQQCKGICNKRYNWCHSGVQQFTQFLNREIHGVYIFQKAVHIIICTFHDFSSYHSRHTV